MPSPKTCGAWIEGTYCGEPARLYPAGHYCDAHAPWRYHGDGKPPPVPDPQWTAAAFRERGRLTRPDPLALLPEQCPHEEPKGPRYCALCRQEARKRSL